MSRTTRTSPQPLLDQLIDEPLPQDQLLARSPGQARDGDVPADRLTMEFVRRDLARWRLLAIRRDLEILLNTRRSLVAFPDGTKELSGSLLDFGLSGFRGAGATSAAHLESLRVEIESTIRQFEPRLTEVRVILETDAASLGQPSLRIEAVLAGCGPISVGAGLSYTGRITLGGEQP